MARIETSSFWHPSRSLRTLTAVCGGSLIFWLTSACQTSCNSGNQQLIDYKDGKTHTEGSLQVYETSSIYGEWLHFPANRRFKLEHHLGTMNYTPRVYVAFDSHPIPMDIDASGNVAAATGDVAIIEQMSDDFLLIRNDTCSDQYLYVIITAPADVDAGSAEDGGATQ